MTKKNAMLIGEMTPRMYDRIADYCDIHHVSDWDKINKDSIDAVITNGHLGIADEIMIALPNLKIISCYGVGYDAINVVQAISSQIMVTHTPSVLDADVANTAIMLLLASSRSLIAHDRYVRDGKWVSEGNTPLTNSIEGKKIGFLGMGRIGQHIAKKCEAFSMDISYHTRHNNDNLPYRYYKTLEKMAQDVTYLVIIAPGGASTKHLINKDILSALGSDGTLVNVGRGSIVNEKDLIAALQNKIIKAAALDVFEDEPNIPAELLAMDNVIVQPHIASATIETRQAMGDLTIDNIISFLHDSKAITPVPEMKAAL